MKKTSKHKIPNRHLGQNFLINESIKKLIIDSCEIKEHETVLEIGPGEGALTQLLSNKTKSVIAIETDKGLARELDERFKDSNVKIVHHDILKYDFYKLPKDLKLIGNLPYNISTPIITKILNHKSFFTKAYFTVQLEFGKRLAAPINTKDYGAFSCFAQFHASITLLFKIKNTAFWPVPKVQSCFIELIPKKETVLGGQEEKLFFKIIHEAFKQRRKKLINSLLLFMGKEEWMKVFKELKINPEVRAENVGVNQFIALTKKIGRIQNY